MPQKVISPENSPEIEKTSKNLYKNSDKFFPFDESNIINT